MEGIAFDCPFCKSHVEVHFNVPEQKGAKLPHTAMHFAPVCWEFLKYPVEDLYKKARELFEKLSKR